MDIALITICMAALLVTLALLAALLAITSKCVCRAASRAARYRKITKQRRSRHCCNNTQN